ncbi:MAG: tyrosine-type recombinase/integrase [Pyrinomonadaceae bacterium]
MSTKITPPTASASSSNTKERDTANACPKALHANPPKRFEIKWKNDLLFDSHGIDRRKDTLYEVFLYKVYLPHIQANHCAANLERAVNICKASLAFLKGKPLRSIRAADIERFKAHRTALPTRHGTRRKPATIVRELAVLSRVFSLAIQNDLCDANPCSRVERPRFDNIQNRILKDADQSAFFAAFRSDWALDICRMVLNTGLRQNDILGLSKFSVDLDTGMIRLVQGKTKRIVEIPINEDARRIIEKRWKRPGALLFPSPRTGKQANYVRRAITGACRRAKIDRLTIRDLRRTFGTRLHEFGFDDSTVAQLLGHSDMRSIHRYKRGTEIRKEAVFRLQSVTIPPERLLKKV